MAPPKQENGKSGAAAVDTKGPPNMSKVRQALQQKFMLRICPKGTGHESMPKTIRTYNTLLKLTSDDAKKIPDVHLKEFRPYLPPSTEFCTETEDGLSDDITLEEFIDMSIQNQTKLLKVDFENESAPTLELYYMTPTGFSKDNEQLRQEKQLQEQENRAKEESEAQVNRQSLEEQKQTAKNTQDEAKLKKETDKQSRKDRLDSATTRHDSKTLQESVKFEKATRDFNHTSSSAEIEKSRNKTGSSILAQAGDSASSSRPSDAKALSKLGPAEWSVILSDRGLLKGFLPVTSADQTPAKAPMQAFDISHKKKRVVAAKSGINTQGSDNQSNQMESSSEGTTDGATGLAKSSVREFEEYMEYDIPIYYPCYTTKIDVKASSNSKIKRSLTEGFSSSSIDMSLSASFHSVGGGVSGAAATQDATTDKESQETLTTELVGLYDIPYVKIHLDSYDMKLSKECAQAIAHIRDQESLQSLIKFRKDFGTFFISKVTLGGRLHTSQFKTVTDKQSVLESESKMRLAVSASINIPLVLNGSTGASHEKGTASGNITQGVTGSEIFTWVALGGDKNKAQNPPEWKVSTQESTWWAIINSDDPKDMVELISELPGYEDIPHLFNRILYRGHPKQSWRVPWSTCLHESLKNKPISFTKPPGILGWALEQWKGNLTMNAFDVEAGRITTGPRRDFDLPNDRQPKSAITSTLVDVRQADIITTWKCIGDDTALEAEISAVLPSDNENYPVFGPTEVPDYFNYLETSERVFCVMVTMETLIEEKTVEPQLLTMEKKAQAMLETSIAALEPSFLETYGEHYIFSYTEQRKLVVVWRIQTKFVGDRNKLLEMIRTKLEKPNQIAFSVGCNYITQLVRDHGFSCTPHVFNTRSNKGILVRDEDECLLKDIGNKHIRQSDIIPVDITVKDFRSIVPRLAAPVRKPNQDLIWQRTYLLKRLNKLKERSRTSLLKEDSEAQKSIVEQIGKLVNWVRLHQLELVMDDTGPELFKTIKEEFKVVERLLDVKWAARDWLRDGLKKEAELASLEARQLKAGNYECGRLRLSSSDWNDSIRNELQDKSRFQEVSCGALSAKPSKLIYDDDKLYKCDTPEGYRLLGWSVDTVGDELSSMWKTVSQPNGATYDEPWIKIHIWKDQSPMVVRLASGNGQLILKTRWLKADEFPFEEALLWDFQGFTQTSLTL